MEKIRPVAITAIRRNGIIYIVEHATSDTAKETALDKVKKLIMGDSEIAKKCKAS